MNEFFVGGEIELIDPGDVHIFVVKGKKLTMKKVKKNIEMRLL